MRPVSKGILNSELPFPCLDNNAIAFRNLFNLIDGSLTFVSTRHDRRDGFIGHIIRT